MFWILFSLLLAQQKFCPVFSEKFEEKREALRKECLRNSENKTSDGVAKCPDLFFAACWPETVANTTVTQACPALFFNPGFGNITRRCNESGQWEKPNISSCRRYSRVNSNYDEFTRTQVYVAMSWVSLSVMVPSLLLTLHFFKCRNERFNVHSNLIVAFIFRIITFFVHHYGDLGNPERSRITCNVFWILNRYFAAAEIMWMFNEALLLLRKVIIIFNKKSYLKHYLLLGWGTPFILIVAVYVPVMLAVSDPPGTRCWIEIKESRYMYVIYGPLAIVLFVNFAILMYTVSIFVRRQKPQRKTDFLKIRKAIKGTLVLSPLLGVIYLLIFFTPSGTPLWYQYFLRIIYPMQGTLACLVYLTFSAELLHKAKTRYGSSRRERRSLIDNGHSWSLSRSKNTERSLMPHRAIPKPFPSIDASCQSRSSPLCDNGPKCDCSDTVPVLQSSDCNQEDRRKILNTTAI